jgi:hypothetical protein
MATQVTLNSGSVDSAGSLALKTNGTTTAVTVDTSQNVGIGTASPAYKFDLVGQSRVTMGGSPFAFLMRYDSSSAPFIIGSPSANAMSFSNSDGTERMRIDSSGNLGIGTSSPTLAKLQIAQSSSSAGAIYATAAAGQNGNAYAFGISGISNGYQITNDGSNNIAHIWSGTGGAERMRIDTSGNLLVNTTSAIAAAGYLQVSGATSTQNGIGIKATGSGTQFLAGFYNSASTVVGSINTNGTTTAYSTSSDYRLKENIAPMTGALAKVAALKPVTYKWKADGSDSQGFIAHELQTVVPDCVTGEKDAVDADGNPKYQGIDTSFLVATLTAAIQEQQAIIQTLTDRITALEAK